jgi:PTS system fructose-specific IIA component
MSDFVQASHVFLNNPAKNVEEALEFLSAQAVKLGIADDEKAVLDAFKAREAEGTTGMMEGFAIPHAKADAVKKAMDNKPIKVAIALCVPGGEAGTTHLKLLSKVAVMLMDETFRKDVLAADDPAAIAERINDGLDA